MFNEANEVSETELENVMFILLGVHNTGNKYPDQGSSLHHMENVIQDVLSRECSFFSEARRRAVRVAEEEVHRYIGSDWMNDVISRREPSETLATFLARDGDVFTTREDGWFTSSKGEQMKFNEWRGRHFQ